MQKSVLENGIRVITERIPAAHSATIGFWVENGSRHEPVAQNGISHFIEHMLFKGTRRRTAHEIAKEVDSVGGVLNGFTSREFSCYYAKVLARKLPMAVDLLSDIVLNSVFDHEEIEKERRVILQEIHMQEDTPDDLIHDLFSQRFWYDHPLGHSVLGKQESVGEFSRDTLLGFLTEQYCGKNILICAAGNLEHEQLTATINGAFRRVVPGRKGSTIPFVAFRRGLSIEDKDLEQAHLCLGTRALPQDHGRRFQSYLLNTILGGSMSSRLFQKIREEQGLAYSVYSYLNCHSDTGALVVYAGTSPGEALGVIRTMLGELHRLRSEPVTVEELHSAKEQLKGNLLLSMESTDNRMTRLAKNEIYLGRQGSLKEVLSGIQKVTRESILELAQEILRDEYLNLQVIGNAAKADLKSVELTLDS
ncbi:MAG: insulinase family protein [Desulfuromonadales bacterium]|nr:insulinase family protein [Desulfuromonadales bacterium]